MKKISRPYWLAFERLAHCESGGRWRIVNPPYSGGIQFVASSWRAVGGAGIAADASKLEQVYRGTLLMKRAGWGSWPVCRRAAGF